MRAAMPYVLAVWLFVVGLFGIVRSKNLIHAVVCVAVAQASTYVLLLEVGYRAGASAPIFKDVPQSTRAVDPVVQALVLTDLVIGVGVAALILALTLQAHKASHSLDPSRMRELKG
jgi:multicomponent Na+:H+ antiporter subunit C